MEPLNKSRAVATGCFSGWDARSEPKRMVDPLREARDKADRPKNPRPFGLQPNAASASPCSSGIVGLATTFVARLASIRIGPCSAAAWDLFRGSLASSVLLAGALPLLAACVSLTADPRALIYEPSGIKVQSLKCAAAIETARRRTNGSRGNANALDPDAIRIFMWNIHKEGDAGWQEDLTRFARSNDVLLLQEVTLLDSLQEILISRVCAGSWPVRLSTRTPTSAC